MCEKCEAKETFCEGEMEHTHFFRVVCRGINHQGSNAVPCLTVHLWLCSTEPVPASQILLFFWEGEIYRWNMYSDCTHHTDLPLRGAEKTFAATDFSLLSASQFLPVFIRASAFMDISTGLKAF